MSKLSDYLGSAGITDHGLLTGLGDDDHTQYLNNARGDIRYVMLTTNQTIAGIKTWTSNAIFSNSVAINATVDPAYKLNVGGSVNLAAGENYYINGVPISTFIDAPSDGNVYGRQDAAWVQITTGGGGTVTDLSNTQSGTTVTILNTGGANTTVPAANTVYAGVMTAAMVTKLNNIADNANKYIHPAYPADAAEVDSGVMSGAKVLSDIDMNISSDAEGHVTDVNMSIGTRNLTPADIGAADAGDIPRFVAGVENLSIAGTNASGDILRVELGNLVILTGRLSWTTVSTGTSQVLISGLTYEASFATGCAVGQNNIQITNSQRNGVSMTIDAGNNYFRLWHMLGEDPRTTVKYQDMKASGSIDINISYYSTAVPAFMEVS